GPLPPRPAGPHYRAGRPPPHRPARAARPDKRPHQPAHGPSARGLLAAPRTGRADCRRGRRRPTARQDGANRGGARPRARAGARRAVGEPYRVQRLPQLLPSDFDLIEQDLIEQPPLPIDAEFSTVPVESADGMQTVSLAELEVKPEPKIEPPRRVVTGEDAEI